MPSHPGGSPVQLQAHRLLHIQDGAGLTVTCRAGAVWITQESDVRDIILERGELFTLDREGLTLVHAVRDAIVDVSHGRGAWSAAAQPERMAAA